MPSTRDRSPTNETRAPGQLSQPFDARKTHFDVIVVGSGYGGAVCAARLAEAGFDVLVLERGREFKPGGYPAASERSTGRFPRTFWQTIRESQADWMNLWRINPLGLYDYRFGDAFNVVVGCGLGGTSLINANVSMEPEREIFDWAAWPTELRREAAIDPGFGSRWPDASPSIPRGPGIVQPLSYYFSLARAMLGPTPYLDRPSQDPPGSLAGLDLAATALPTERARRAEINVSFADVDENAFGVKQARCVGCGDCVSGCNYEAKNTVCYNYLPLARHFGATIFTRCEVDVVTAVKSTHGRHRYEVDFKHYLDERWVPRAEEHRFTATAVVMAAGSLGSTEILLRSHERGGLTCARPLGARWSSNGDLLSFGFDSRERIDPVGTGVPTPPEAVPAGATIVGLVAVDRPGGARNRILIEDGHFPTSTVGVVRFLLPLLALFSSFSKVRGFWARLVAAWSDWRHSAPVLSRSAVYLSMGHDGARGRLQLGPNRRAGAVWEHPLEMPLFRDSDEEIQRMNDKIGATHVRTPLWQARAGQLITVHPLGGCPMGDDRNSGAVDHAGRVYQGEGRDPQTVYEGLYVADGAIVPTSLGVNPLLTITALAERVAEHAARDLGRPFTAQPATAIPKLVQLRRAAGEAG